MIFSNEIDSDTSKMISNNYVISHFKRKWKYKFPYVSLNRMYRIEMLE